MQQRFSLGLDQDRSLGGWSAAPIFFAVRRPMPDGLDVARSQFGGVRHGLPCFVEPIHLRGLIQRYLVSVWSMRKIACRTVAPQYRGPRQVSLRFQRATDL